MFQTEIEEREETPPSTCLLCETAKRGKFYAFILLSKGFILETVDYMLNEFGKSVNNGDARD